MGRRLQPVAAAVAGEVVHAKEPQLAVIDAIDDTSRCYTLFTTELKEETEVGLSAVQAGPRPK
jgi:hypothetical protein